MIKLLDFLKEDITYPSLTVAHPEEWFNTVDRIISAAKNMGESNPILWRGVNTKYVIAHVSNAREHFRGGNLGAKTIMQELGVKYPSFGYFDKALTELFGKPRIVVLEKPYTLYQSKEVQDVMDYASRDIYKTQTADHGTTRRTVGHRSEEEIIQKAKEGAKTFEKLNNGKPILPHREVVIDAPNYWLLSSGLQELAGKFVPKDHEFKTYKDVVDILYKYKSYKKFQIKNTQEKPSKES